MRERKRRERGKEKRGEKIERKDACGEKMDGKEK